ncbi:D-alanyl-D-alanine carboxypeptidase family protein [Aquihabitans sp. G128]|uniref:D-alanyl-D-alanine carboxypeptidase family protein n=1 Tax=Aquihabitans sp. G128 TaxID=2849779 RepID=UPI001C246C9D|nr:D-alanyl-D-alanine carboxypeptidase family protein [Aquihabitans sp. G128]QXC62753.1 D-alanyl-D-alanine carboxypeptidase family protein [Aquihabitans sp. G128]
MTLAVLVATVGLAAPQLASSAPREDPRAERERVRAERAELATKIDTTKASLSEIDDAIQALQENLAGEERALEKAEAAVAQAKKDIADAEKAIAARNGEIKVLKAEMRTRAVRAYVSPPGDDVLTVLGTKDFTSAAERRFYVDLRAQDDVDLADNLDGAVTDLAYQKRKAAAAKKRADAQRAEQQKRTESVRQAEAQQQSLSDKLQATVDSQISRSVELGKTDRALSAKIAKQQAELVARLAAQKAAQQERDRRAALAAAAAANQPPPTTVAPVTPPPSNQSPGGGESNPLPPVSGGGGGGTGTGGISLCTVGGITVNCAIRTQLTNLLNGARASGLALTGGGYRDPAAQIELRKAHCGTSYYAIYEMPASSCHPPTARPGSSQHELGLAIDFSNCSSRSSACYRWLAANAAGYGFYNLPSEPWHWSTTGN